MEHNYLAGLEKQLITLDGSTLCCPECGDNYLHHNEVMVYTRSKEDGPTTVTLVHGHGDTGVHVLPYSGNHNPSSRRDGIAIRFSCEGCQFDGELIIAQHKGETNLQWRRLAR